MILVDSADRSKAGLDARIVLAGQLAALGHSAGLDAATIPEDISADLTYQLAPLLVDIDDVGISRVVVIAGGAVADEMLSTLRGYALGRRCRCRRWGGWARCRPASTCG
jgi:hypothetical protein